MDDLPTWLRAQLDVDARVANESWTAQPEKLDMRRVTVDYSIEFVVACTLAWRGEHIARFDPARVLREVEAKRRTIEWCVEVIGDRDLSRYGEFGLLKDDPDALAVTLAVEQLKITGLPFSDRPGYREEWAV